MDDFLRFFLGFLKFVFFFVCGALFYVFWIGVFRMFVPMDALATTNWILVLGGLSVFLYGIGLKGALDRQTALLTQLVQMGMVQGVAPVPAAPAPKPSQAADSRAVGVEEALAAAPAPSLDRKALYDSLSLGLKVDLPKGFNRG
jgi:hypothetical protein